jgi:hypothetical protein
MFLNSLPKKQPSPFQSMIELNKSNIELEQELEHWKTVALQTERFNCELKASLEAAQSNTIFLQRENDWIIQVCR